MVCSYLSKICSIERKYLDILDLYFTWLIVIFILFHKLVLALVFRWTYADPSWARIAALVPVVVSCAEAGDEVANKILLESVQELALSVKAVVKRLGLCGEGILKF